MSFSSRIDVQFRIPYSYPVFLTDGLFSAPGISGNGENLSAAEYLKTQKNSVADLIVDEGVVAKVTDRLQAFKSFFEIEDALVLTGGEAIKEQPDIVDKLHQRWLGKELDRHKQVVIIGGGAVLDAAGFAASLFHRGMGHIRMPSTVLAQNDAGVGVKNGVNKFEQKNFVGCFKPPTAVINDYQLLSTLEDQDFYSGYAEAVKVALIRSPAFYSWLTHNSEALASKKPEQVKYLIALCAQLHLNQISQGGDPFEEGSARPLDFGHWLGHRLEVLTNHQLTHGEAVAIGIASDTALSVELGLLEAEHLNQVVSLLRGLKLPVFHELVSAACETPQSESFLKLYKGLEDFRQHLGGQLSIELLKGLGKGFAVNEIKPEQVLSAFRRVAGLC